MGKRARIGDKTIWQRDKIKQENRGWDMGNRIRENEQGTKRKDNRTTDKWGKCKGNNRQRTNGRRG